MMTPPSRSGSSRLRYIRHELRGLDHIRSFLAGVCHNTGPQRCQLYSVRHESWICPRLTISRSNPLPSLALSHIVRLWHHSASRGVANSLSRPQICRRRVSRLPRLARNTDRAFADQGRQARGPLALHPQLSHRHNQSKICRRLLCRLQPVRRPKHSDCRSNVADRTHGAQPHNLELLHLYSARRGPWKARPWSRLQP